MTKNMVTPSARSTLWTAMPTTEAIPYTPQTTQSHGTSSRVPHHLGLAPPTFPLPPHPPRHRRLCRRRLPSRHCGRSRSETPARRLRRLRKARRASGRFRRGTQQRVQARTLDLPRPCTRQHMTMGIITTQEPLIIMDPDLGSALPAASGPYPRGARAVILAPRALSW